MVAGGGNSAVEAAIDLAKIAAKVTLVHRSQLKSRPNIIIDKLKSYENVDIRLETEIIEVKSAALMSGVLTKDKATGEERLIDANGLFVEIGYVPNSTPVEGAIRTQLKRLN